MMPPKSAGRAKVILRNSSDRMDFKPLVVCIAHFSFILFPAVPPAAVAISLSLHCVILILVFAPALSDETLYIGAEKLPFSLSNRIV